MRIRKAWFVYSLLAIALSVIITVIKTDGDEAKYSDIIIPEETKIVDVQEIKPLESSFGSDADSSESNAATANPIDNVQEATITSDENPEVDEETAAVVTPAPTKQADVKPVQVKITPTPEPKKVVPDAVDEKVNSIADKDVQMEDYLEIIQVITGKLSLEEIKYLFDSARDDYWVATSVEDIEEAREILFTKLSDEDLEKLNQLGREYGRSMDIIKKDIDVAQVKENQMRSLGLIE